MPATFSKDMGELDNGNVNKYYTEVVKMSLEDTKRRVAKVMPIVQEILKYINGRDSRFAKQPECIGSYWQGLEIEKADEFDVNVDVLGCSELVYCPDKKKFIGFNKQVDDPSPTMSDDLTIVCKSSPLPASAPGYEYIYWESDKGGWAEWIVDGLLVPFLVKRRFFHLLLEAIRTLELRGKVRQSKLLAGPALTVHVMDEKGDIVADVDFAPNMKSVVDFPVKWPKGHVEWPSREKIQAVLAKRTSMVPRKNFCWWQSYAQADQELSCGIDADGGCRKLCLRMMKKMRSDVWCSTSTTLTSYHLKNTLWWECQERPHSWSIERVAFNFISLVRRLHGYVKERSLPLYFNPSVNLFIETPTEDLKTVEIKLEEFLQNPSYFVRAALSEK